MHAQTDAQRKFWNCALLVLLAAAAAAVVVVVVLPLPTPVWDWSTGKQLYRLNGEATDAISARFEGPWLCWNGISRTVLLMDYS